MPHPDLTQAQQRRPVSGDDPTCTTSTRRRPRTGIAFSCSRFSPRRRHGQSSVQHRERDERLVHLPRFLGVWGFHLRAIRVDCRQTNTPPTTRVASPTGTWEAVVMSCRGTRGVVMLLVAVAMLSGCTKSQVHLQEPSPSLSPTTVSSASPSTDPSSPAPVVKPIPTPTVSPAAQGAVDAYIAFANASAIADRDPVHANLTFIATYLTGSAKTMVEQSYSAMKSSGRAYRGTPANPRLKVSAVLSPTAVILTSCPEASKTDPYTLYDIRTGGAIVLPTRSPPPPYLLTLAMRQTNGQWQIANVTQEAGKTCGA